MAKRLKEATLKIDVFRNDIPEVFPSIGPARINVIEKGRMIQLGDHDTLLKKMECTDTIPKFSCEVGM